MHNALAMRGVEGVGNLQREIEKLFQFERPARDQLFQRCAFQIFQHKECAPGVFADVVDGADVGMAEG
jgi:hypothetical protein